MINKIIVAIMAVVFSVSVFASADHAASTDTKKVEDKKEETTTESK